MTSAEVLEECAAPNRKGVFFLGSFEKRVTFLSQQIRALNLVDALLDQHVIRDTGRIAVIGGGAAGITAAAALAAAAPDLKGIDLYERKNQILHLQRQSRDRYLHPHLYDWPAPGSTQTDAGLPILNWSAGPAGDVAKIIERQFDEVCRIAPIQVKKGRYVDQVVPFQAGGCRISVEGAPKDGAIYDAAIISVGFGYESLIAEQTHSYWAPSVLVGPIRSAADQHLIFISGNGDGGLVDFQLAAFNGLEHREICNFITQYHGLDDTKRVLIEIEERAWAATNPLDIFAEYQRLVVPVLPHHMLLDVQDLLRPDALVWLHTREPYLFRRDTALLNRFGAMLAIAADRNAMLNRIHLCYGKEFVGPTPLSGPVEIQGEAPFTPDYRFLRFGADRDACFAPFRDLADAYRAERERRSLAAPGFRPATPRLAETARARFTAAASRIHGTGQAIPAPVTAERRPREKSASHSELTSGLRHEAASARAGLEPFALKRIPRTIVKTILLPRVRQSMRDPDKRLIAVVGPAGFGKSTILGELFDCLASGDSACLAVVLCGSLGANITGRLDEEFGRNATGTDCRITEALPQVADACGSGVLLIDTVDLILSRETVGELRAIVGCLLRSNVTVVFTCRDHEFGDLLEPLHQTLGAISRVTNSFKVPPFSYPDEVRLAATAFINSRTVDPSRGNAFVSTILDLAADNRSLRELTQNPLLLAMICDLFGDDGYVPPDLTVSALWQDYWEKRIGRARHAGSAAVSRDKELLCLDIAKKLLAASHDRMHVSLYESELGALTTPSMQLAWKELLSENVVERERRSGRIGVFHQTLLEYAIARYLAAPSNWPELRRLLISLSDPDEIGSRLHLFPIIRQLFSILDPSDCVACMSELNPVSLVAFRAVAFASASRDDASLLRPVYEFALRLGSEHQKTLLLALDAAPSRLAAEAFDVAIGLLRHGENEVASVAAHMCADLLSRWGAVLGDRLGDVVDAVWQSQDRGLDRAAVVGAVLSRVSTLASGVGARSLRALRRYYQEFSAGLRSQVVELHLRSGASKADREELLSYAVRIPLDGKERPGAVALASDLMAPQDLIAKLSESSLHNWEEVYIEALAIAAVSDEQLVAGILADILKLDGGVAYRNALILVEAIHRGGKDLVLNAILSHRLELPQAALGQRKAVADVLEALASVLTQERRDIVLGHVRHLVEQFPAEFLAAAFLLAGETPGPSGSMSDLALRLQSRDLLQSIRRFLRKASRPVLAARANDVERLLTAPGIQAKERRLVERLLVDVYRAKLDIDASAVAPLMRMAASESESVAKAAAMALADAASQGIGIRPGDIAPLARSRSMAVREHWVSCLLSLSQQGNHLDEGELVDVLLNLEDSKGSRKARHKGYELFRRWLRTERVMSRRVADAFGALLGRSLEEGAVHAAQVKALKVAAQSAEAPAWNLVRQWVENVTFSVDLHRIRDGEHEFADTLMVVAKRDPSFLPKLVGECASLPPRNARALAIAISRVEGSNSPLLIQMLNDPGCPGAARGLVLSMKGA